MKKYLFFDLEYATSKGGIEKICEFGYVITNEEFDVLERNNLIINPNISRKDWDYYVVKKILTRKIEIYEKQPFFEFYYSKIKSLINECDFVFGHSLDSDAKALNGECERYNLPAINFEFRDLRNIYKKYENCSKNKSLLTILEEMNIEGEKSIHDAETDSFNTMLVLKEMIKTLNEPLEFLIELYSETKNESKDYEVKSIIENKIKKDIVIIGNLSFNKANNIIKHSINEKRFFHFLNNVKPQSNGCKFKGVKISISKNYEEFHFCQMLNLIQLIVNEGGILILKSSLSDIFVKYDVINDDGTKMADSRYKYVLESIDNGSKIEIFEFNVFLEKLNISEEKLNSMPLPSFDFIYNDDLIIKNVLDRKIIGMIKKINNGFAQSYENSSTKIKH